MHNGALCTFYRCSSPRRPKGSGVPSLSISACRDAQGCSRRRSARRGEFEGARDFGPYWYDGPASKSDREFNCVLGLKDAYGFYERKLFAHPMTHAECEAEERQVQSIPSVGAKRHRLHLRRRVRLRLEALPPHLGRRSHLRSAVSHRRMQRVHQDARLDPGLPAKRRRTQSGGRSC